MGSLGGSGFGKKRRCPSSDLLLSYHQYDLSAEQTSRVASHLAICDFCAAELQLLSRYPPAQELCERTPMPGALRALAEALFLKDRSRTEALLFRISGKGAVASELS